MSSEREGHGIWQVSDTWDRVESIQGVQQHKSEMGVTFSWGSPAPDSVMFVLNVYNFLTYVNLWLKNKNCDNKAIGAPIIFKDII